MASAPPRKPRVSRKGDIPYSFVQNWRSSGPKQLVRRPMTACHACRTARVKCDSQPQCNRCSTRDIVCMYTHDHVRELSVPSDISSATTATDIAPLWAPAPTTIDMMAMDSETTTVTNRPLMDTTEHYEDLGVMTGWPPDVVHQELDDFVWPPTDTTFNGHSLMALAPIPQTHFSNDHDVLRTSDLAQTDQMFLPPKCQCRESLVTLVPNVNTAIQNKQLDEVFRGMQRVVQGFQNIIHCTVCDITCVDLICIMAAFQQTGPGFEYISTTDLDRAINMTFGGREVPIHDLKLRAMLVTSLIHQAHAILDAIGAKGQHMLKSLCMPSSIAETNIGHLNKVIGEFRSVLHDIAESADKAALPQECVSVTV